MAEFSLPWPDTSDPLAYDPLEGVIGDGRKHTAAEFATFLTSLFGNGVIPVGNMLAVTSPGANQIAVATGYAHVQGHWLGNNSVKSLTPASAPAGTTRKDRVLLECDWTGGGQTEQYTVRVITKEGNAVNPPDPSQTPNVLWQDLHYRYTIDDAGNITDIVAEYTEATYHTRVTTAMAVAGLLATSGAGRALMADGFFDAATVLTKFAALAVDRSVLARNAQIPIGVCWPNPEATLGGSDGRRMVVGGIAYESWVHCDGGAAVNGITIPDYRGKVIAGASAAHPAGTTGGADTANLLHLHNVGTLTQAQHRHWVEQTLSHSVMTEPVASGAVLVTGAILDHVVAVFTDYKQPALSGATAAAGSAAQDMRQPTAYVYMFIYVG